MSNLVGGEVKCGRSTTMKQDRFFFFFLQFFGFTINWHFLKWSGAICGLIFTLELCRNPQCLLPPEHEQAATVWDKWESIFSNGIVRWFESVSATKTDSSSVSAMSDKINSLLLTRHHFPKQSLNSHWYNNNVQQPVKQKSAVFYPTFLHLLPQWGNMSRCTD